LTAGEAGAKEEPRRNGLFLPVLLGTVRRENHSRDVARFLVAQGARRSGVETRLFDPLDLPFGNLAEREWEMSPQPPSVSSFVAEMGRADGFVIVSPEYNHGVPGALKNLLDHLYDEWNHKPFALVGVSNGPNGGARMIEQLRQIIPGVQGVTIPGNVQVREVQDYFRDGKLVKDEGPFTARFDRLWTELERYARALRTVRSPAQG
jgi:NAD(P)H-dependent FMN reductase